MNSAYLSVAKPSGMFRSWYQFLTASDDQPRSPSSNHSVKVMLGSQELYLNEAVQESDNQEEIEVLIEVRREKLFGSFAPKY